MINNSSDEEEEKKKVVAKWDRGVKKARNRPKSELRGRLKSEALIET